MAASGQVVVRDDPYALTKEGIKDPPSGWGPSLRFLGPGMIMTASIVGSGELIATTTMGATAGFILLWVVLFSCAVKVALQVELARYVVSTGIPTLAGYNLVPPKIGPYSWVCWVWAIFAITKWIQSAGIVGGVAQTFAVWVPIFDITVWTAIVVVVTIAILFSNAYGLIEVGAFWLVVIFTIVTVLIAFGLPFTPYGYTSGDLISGLTFQLPPAAVASVVGMFGITGVGADEITMYPYWCLEKGYARWTGPKDGSEAWYKRANGWLNVMYKDITVSFIIYTFATMAFFLMGAAVLYKQGIKAEGAGTLTMIKSLARMYTDTLGGWAGSLFLLGSFAVLGSTLWAAVPSWSRQWTNWMGIGGIIDWTNPSQRIKVIRAWTVFLTILWGAVYLFVQQPVQMVLIGGLATGVFLLVVVVATVYLRQTYTDKRLYGGTPFNAFLGASCIAIFLFGIYTLAAQFGFKF
ncbi:MAG: Nramp family divalent metal transporter [Chloroflexota bacterium]